MLTEQLKASSHQQQQASSSNAHAGKAGDGGSWSARTDERGGSERRRRQSKSKAVGVGLGTDSSEDIGAGRKQVRFEGKDFEVADRVDACRFESNSFEIASVNVTDVDGILDKGQDCACRSCTCLVCEATVSSAVTAWYPSHNDDKHDNNEFSEKPCDR